MRKSKKLLGLLLTGMGLAGAAMVVRPLVFDLTRAEESSQPREAVEEKGRPVSTTAVKRLLFVEGVRTQGNLESARHAAVPAKLPGILEEIYVQEGDRVLAGETRLFKTESLKLEKTLEIRRHELSVARFSLLEKRALLEQVEAELHKAGLDYKRFQRLQAQRTVSDDAMEQQESHYHQLLATRKHTLALIDLAAEQVSQARAALAIAEKDLRDAVVVAPLSGVISRRNLEPGEMGDTNTPVVSIEDPTRIEVSALIPARYYPLIVPGRTEAAVKVHGLDLGRRPVSYKSPTIDAKLRTFEIKCLLDNPDGRLAPGSMAEIEVIILSRSGLGVPREAIVVRQGRSAVFTVASEEARLVYVQTGLETEGWVEIEAEGLAAGGPVVTSGQTSLDPGVKVRLMEGTS